MLRVVVLDQPGPVENLSIRRLVDTTRSHAAEHQLRYRYAGTDDERVTGPAVDANASR